MIDWIAISLGITKDTVVTGLITVAIAIPTIGVAVWAVRRSSKPTHTAPESGIRVDANVLAEKYAEEARKRGALEAENANLRTELAGRDEQAEKAVAAAIADLQEDSRTAADPAPFDKALAELAEGRPDAAENLFAEILDRRKAEGQAALKEAAEAARHIGAIAFYHDTQKALAAYVEATELDPDDAEAWNQLGHLQHRLGNLAAAETAYQTVLRLGNSMEDRTLLAVAYGNLGNVFRTRGSLDDAEEMYRKALALNEALASKEGMANQYGNLGVVYQTRGDLDDAEEMYRKALALNEALGRKEGMASDYGNLGNVYLTRGNLDDAEEMYRKALALNEALGRKEGMANQYGNLGNVYLTRGDLDDAEEMYRKALALNEALGRKEGMAGVYGNLGIVYRTRGELDDAEEMYRKSLAIEEALGRKEGLANQYGNLGSVFHTRGDIAAACQAWAKARDLFAGIGATQKLEQVSALMKDAGCES